MPKKLNLMGTKFQHLTVVGEGHLRKFPSGGEERFWLCKCECGVEKYVRTQSLRSGESKTCGTCALSRKLKGHGKSSTHGHSKHKHRSPTYSTYSAMKTRCTNPNVWNYKYYGGKGVQVCDRWLHSFENFLADMGERPEKMTLDRINPNGPYSPENCRWADDSTQRRNTSGPRKKRTGSL